MRFHPTSLLLFSMLLVFSCRPDYEAFTPAEEQPILLPQVTGKPGDGSVRLEWGWIWWGSHEPTESSQPSAFRLLMGVGAEVNLREIALVPGDETAFVVPNLSNQQVYFFAVETLMDNQPGIRSNVIAVSPGRWTEPEPLFPNSNMNRYWGSWSQDGSSIAYVRDGGEEASIFSYQLSTQQETYWGGGTQPHWQTAHGQLLFVTDLIHNRMAADTLPTYLGLLDESQVTLYLGGDGSYLHPNWSPDGRRMAFLGSTQNGAYQLYQTVFGSTPNPQQLTFGFPALGELAGRLARSPQHPVWYPDGQWIAYERFAPKEGLATVYAKDIYQVASDGSGVEEPLVVSSWEDFRPAFSPDGRKLAFISDRSGIAGIWIKDLSNGSTHQIYGGVEPAIDTRNGRLAWSPSGSTLLFNAWMNDSLTSLYQIQVER